MMGTTATTMMMITMGTTTTGMITMVARKRRAPALPVVIPLLLLPKPERSVAHAAPLAVQSPLLQPRPRPLPQPRPLLPPRLPRPPHPVSLPLCKTMYTWTTACPQTANTYGIECPPMFWGANMQDQITDAVHNSNASHVMGFNEPDLSSQSNLSPQDAAQLWKDYMLGFKSLGKQLVSPATTAGGLQWFDDFLTALGGLPASQIDVIAVHWYGTDFTDFQNYVNSWKKYGKNIWVTEMACQDFSGQGKWCSMDDIQSLMSQAMAWMESDPQIEKYFWFAPMRDMTNVNPLNCLMTIGGPNDGQPTSLGWYYVSN
ncbi:glycoside hydrolase family 128 protein [Botryobasidium botryosum FD-172 SS1]|uniref:Glycoside hydrolase family 128 protein n=1 Tax=Botryobasidium botryosum (strain FD-172 SS1) TaxID=930990 RepID=A0A067MG59_BOTB1|nr:glycoside hydrolase family 128 protein [Botryobasidium botryosum FD-172 SS1]